MLNTTRQRILILMLVIAAGGALWTFRLSSKSTEAFRPSPAKAVSSTAPMASSPAANAAATPPAASATEPAPRLLKHGRLRILKGQPIPEVFPHQAERQAIQQLADTYDAKNIPAIAVYLSHADDTVRAAARSALIQLGDAAAIPYLETAAKQAASADEAEALREAVSFLKLPPLLDPQNPPQSPPAP